VMDFRTDTWAQNVSDQFLFGPAILVNPVVEPGASSRRLYLPDTTWYDFWTGSSTKGRRSIEASAPLDRLPLFVRAGSILPLGPDIEYAAEKPANPIEIRVYRGANGTFTLYEDENDGYKYEKGVYSTIPLSWDESSHRLTIGNRNGSFPGMLEARTFHIVFVGENHGTGSEMTETPDKVVNYSGKAITVNP
jgi:alpha-D-xyloside xylohydrolase